MSSPLQTQNPELSLQGQLTSNNEGPSSLSAWRKLLMAIIGCMNDILYLYNLITGGAILTVQDAAPLTGDTVVSNGSNILAINPAGTLATLSVSFPASPKNGQPFNINFTQTITLLTLTPSAGTTIQAYTTSSLFAGNILRYVYDQSQTQWLIN